MVHETTSFTGIDVFLEDPEFTDRNNRDYHLSTDSPAIDVCADNPLGFDIKDIDFKVRGIDNPDINNINGSFDLGADEAGGDDLIFKNGFES